MSLMDVPLHYHMHEASLNGNAYDMTRIFEGTLVATTPTLAVTFVDNHDTLLFHGLASPVADWFKPLAYALVLLRRGGYPAVFHADYYGGITRNGATQQVITLPSHRQVIDVLLRLRRDHAYGEEVDFFGGGSRQLIGWTRAGRGKALAVVLSSGPGGARRMRVAAGGGARFVDALGHVKGEVTTDGGGGRTFRARVAPSRRGCRCEAPACGGEVPVCGVPCWPAWHSAAGAPPPRCCLYHKCVRHACEKSARAVLACPTALWPAQPAPKASA